MDFKENLIKAGEIARKAREYAKEICRDGAKFIDVTNKIENKIIELGGKPAFPVDISIDYIAAHDTPLYNDERAFKKGDLAKIDLGVHINGYIADTAVSIEINSEKNQKLIEASEKALKEAVKLAIPGVSLFEIGQAINEQITKLGFVPIKNLGGHGLGEYLVHTPPTIPNYNNNDQTKLKGDMIIAIEPFATTGQGFVVEGKLSSIYSLLRVKNVRNFEARKIIKFIDENYRTLPFAERWIVKNFGIKAQILLKILENENIIEQFNVLPEKSKALVSQAEHTILVGHGVVT